MSGSPASGPVVGRVLLYTGWVTGFAGVLSGIGVLMLVAGALFIATGCFILVRRDSDLAQRATTTPSWWSAPRQDPRFIAALMIFIGLVWIAVGTAAG